MTAASGLPLAAGNFANHRVKILLVDDSADNLVSLEAALDGLGQELVFAQSGAEALRHLLENDFAVILLDVKMPEIDGFQTAELIRARKRSRHTPILFLTAFRSDEHLFRGYDLGAVDFLFKPIVPEILRSKINVFVDMSRNHALLQRQTEVLGKAEQKFRSLLEAAPDAMIIGSEEGEISLVNSRVETLFGYRREELIGRNIRLLVPLWSHSVAPSDLSAKPLLAMSMGYHHELLARRKDGSEFPSEITRSPLRTDEGVLVISAIRDIAEQKKAHEEIRELNTTLERRVAERTHALLESNEALRQSNDDLNQFAYAASHDLQEPLRMISIYSELLQRKYAGEFDEEANQFISFVLNGAHRMEVLLKDLLAYSQAGSTEGPAGPVDFSAALRQVLLNLQAAIGENGAVITWSGLPTIQAHQIRLVQLLQNLIGNAIKYRGTDAPRVHIAAERRDAGWMFSIADNGIGIKPEYAQQVFGIFKRLHGQAYPGTGIGLAICQRIVERYGGRIWVESTPGMGSKFCFTFPDAAVKPGPAWVKQQAAGDSGA